MALPRSTRRQLLRSALALPAGTWLTRYAAWAAPHAGQVKITAIKAMQLDFQFDGCLIKIETDSGLVGYGETGRVKLTTLTKEFFVPGFLERDEGEREPSYEMYPWDGVSGVRPFHGFASSTTVGVY